jgi:predicted thioesterase
VIDHDRARGLVLPAFVVQLTRERVRAFAAAVGATDPVHHHLDAARADGHPDLLATPTLLAYLESEPAQPLGFLAELGADLGSVLHAAQSYEHHASTHAGDRIEICSHIADSRRKGTRLDLVLKHTDFRRDGVLVAEAESLFALRLTGDR